MLEVTIGEVTLRLQTEPSLFSPQRADAGTLAMLSLIRFEAQDKVLDLGCGYGLVGILAAHHLPAERVVMLDNDPTAVAIARRNADANGVPQVTVALSDGVRDTRETGFTKIISNPPYHVDFAVPKHFIEKGFNRLMLGGTMWMAEVCLLWRVGVMIQRRGEIIFFDFQSLNHSVAGQHDGFDQPEGAPRNVQRFLPHAYFKSSGRMSLGQAGQQEGGPKRHKPQLFVRTMCPLNSGGLAAVVRHADGLRWAAPDVLGVYSPHVPTLAPEPKDRARRSRQGGDNRKADRTALNVGSKIRAGNSGCGSRESRSDQAVC